MRRHLQLALTTLRRDLKLPPERSDHAVLLTLLPAVRYIWLVREDIVRQAVSLCRAKQTNLWTAREDATFAPVFEFEKIEQCVTQLQRTDKKWEEWFAAQRLAPLRVTYESLTSDYGSTVRTILHHIGVPTPAKIKPPTLQRQADALSEDWAQRYLRMKNS